MVDFSTDHLVKICGVTSLVDARLIAASGANAIGLILAESPRRVSPSTAKLIGDHVRDLVLRTLVFRDNSEEFVIECVDLVEPDIVQIHGPLSSSLCTVLQRDGRKVIKALEIGSEEFDEFDERMVDAVLVDGPTPGSGETHSWTALDRRGFNRPVVAAGGLTPENVIATIERVHPWGVDCASGVEASPGRKDPTLVARFVENARQGFEQ